MIAVNGGDCEITGSLIETVADLTVAITLVANYILDNSNATDEQVNELVNKAVIMGLDRDLWNWAKSVEEGEI